MLASIREVFPINGMDQNWSKDKTIARIGDLDALPQKMQLLCSLTAKGCNWMIYILYKSPKSKPIKVKQTKIALK